MTKSLIDLNTSEKNLSMMKTLNSKHQIQKKTTTKIYERSLILHKNINEDLV